MASWCQHLKGLYSKKSRSKAVQCWSQRTTVDSIQNLCVAHFFQSNNIIPEQYAQSTPRSLGKKRRKWSEPCFCRWERKKEPTGKNREKTRPWEVSGNLLVKSVIFSLSVSVAPTTLMLLSALSAIIWTGLGPVSEPIHFLTERKDKKSHREMEEEIRVRVRYLLIRKDIHSLWPGHAQR